MTIPPLPDNDTWAESDNTYHIRIDNKIPEHPIAILRITTQRYNGALHVKPTLLDQHGQELPIELQKLAKDIMLAHFNELGRKEHPQAAATNTTPLIDLGITEDELDIKTVEELEQTIEETTGTKIQVQ